MSDRRTIKGAPYTAIRAYMEVADDRAVSLTTLTKLPALRHYKSPYGAAERACKALEAEGFVAFERDTHTIRRVDRASL